MQRVGGGVGFEMTDGWYVASGLVLLQSSETIADAQSSKSTLMDTVMERVEAGFTRWMRVYE